MLPERFAPQLVRLWHPNGHPKGAWLASLSDTLNAGWARADARLARTLNDRRGRSVACLAVQLHAPPPLASCSSDPCSAAAARLHPSAPETLRRRASPWIQRASRSTRQDCASGSTPSSPPSAPTSTSTEPRCPIRSGACMSSAPRCAPPPARSWRLAMSLSCRLCVCCGRHAVARISWLFVRGCSWLSVSTAMMNVARIVSPPGIRGAHRRGRRDEADASARGARQTLSRARTSGCGASSGFAGMSFGLLRMLRVVLRRHEPTCRSVLPLFLCPCRALRCAAVSASLFCADAHVGACPIVVAAERPRVVLVRCE